MHTLDLQKESFSEKEKRNIEILDILRKLGPISRPDISQEMGIIISMILLNAIWFTKKSWISPKEGVGRYYWI